MEVGGWEAGAEVLKSCRNGDAKAWESLGVRAVGGMGALCQSPGLFTGVVIVGGSPLIRTPCALWREGLVCWTSSSGGRGLSFKSPPLLAWRALSPKY